MEYVIGCDVGSQAVKVLLLNAQGQVVGEAGSPYEIEYPQPAWAQQNPGHWLGAIISAIRQLLNETGVHPSQVRVIALDAQVDGVIAIDKAGKPLYPAIIWMDRRAVGQVERIAESCDAGRLYDLSGLNLDAYHVAPKIRWLVDNHPEVMDEAAYFLLPGSYVAYALTGELGVDYSNASSTLLMDIRTRKWSDELCNCFNIPMEKLAPILPADQVIGSLLPGLAEQMGLLPSTKIVLGSGDEHAACLGAGVIFPGLVCDITGTAEPVCAASPEPLFDTTGLVETHCHAHPDYWLMENPGFVSGANYRWFRDRFGREEIDRAAREGGDSYDLLNELAARVPAGSDGLILLPTLMGAVTPSWNPHARGVFLGFSLNHGREHFARAIQEGSAYALRDITDRMQAIGLNLKEIRAVGGGARSALWRQIKADVTGLPVALLNTVETTVLGAALLGLKGAGLVNTLEEAVSTCVRVIETRQPNPADQARYEDMYQLYRSAFFAMLPVFEQASGVVK